MSKRVQFVHSYPNQATEPTGETGRTVVFSKADGLYVRRADGTVVGPMGSGSAGTTIVQQPTQPTTGLVDGLIWIDTDAPDPQAVAAIDTYVASMPGALTVQTGKSRIYIEDASVIVSIRASVDTAPVGASLIVDVNLNGTTIFGDQATRPTIIAGANTAKVTPPVAIAAGQYITVDIDQVGSTTAGSDLTVVIRLRRT